MPTCPKCGNRTTAAPARTFSILVENSRGGQSGFSEKKIGTYQCKKCDTKFPVAVDRQHYLVVPADTVKKLESELKTLQMHNEMFADSLRELSKSHQDLKAALKAAREEAEVRDLEGKLRGLERHVEHLRRDKSDLEQRLSATSPITR